MSSSSKLLIICLFIGLLFRLVISVTIYNGDVNNHTGWGESILKNGFSGAYDRDYQGIMQPTYPPLALLSFTTASGLYKIIYNLSWYLNKSISFFPSAIIWALEDQDVLPAFHKIISLVSDIGISLLIFRFCNKIIPRSSTIALLCSLMYLFNPAVWYNSSLWGQLESFPLFFLFLSYWLLTKNKPFVSVICFTAAILSKQLVIIFVPLYFIYFYRLFGLSRILKAFLISITIFYLAYMPFMGKFDLFQPFTIFINRLQTGSGSIWITDHAFNAWIWTSRLEKIPDSVVIYNLLPANYLAYIIFGIIFILIIIKLIKDRPNLINFFYAHVLVAAFSFLVLTRMHERYYAPVLPFLSLIVSKNKWLAPIYILVSLLHLFNLYHNWWFPRFPVIVSWLSVWTNIELISSLFIVSSLIFLFHYLFHKNLKQNDSG